MSETFTPFQRIASHTSVFSMTQPSPTDNGKIQLSLDITNVSNLLNKKWGTYYSSTTYISPLKVESIDINGDSRIGTFSYTGTTGPSVNQIYSRWHAQLGLKVTF